MMTYIHSPPKPRSGVRLVKRPRGKVVWCSGESTVLGVRGLGGDPVLQMLSLAT